MGRLLCLLAGLALETSAWHLFRGGAIPGGGSGGDACGSVPIASLRHPEDFAVGTLQNDARGAVPECPVKEGTTAFQAGGHPGAFQVLENGQVAKLSKAFQRPGDPTGYLQRHVDASAVEWRAYMEMWCLRRLLELPDNESSRSVWEMQELEEHPLMPFVTGGDLAWAPRFYGICQLEDDGRQVLYMVLQNLLGQFNKPCQIDVKLGYMTGEPDGSWKHVRHAIADMFTPSTTHAARVVGYKVWDPVKSEFSQPPSKHSTSVLSLNSAVSTFIDAVPDPLLTFMLDVLTPSKDLLIRMAAWWHDHGVGVLDAIGMSVLMVFECQPQQGVPTPKPLLKLIDFAHLYPHSEHEGWPDNGIDAGMISLARQLARQRVRLAAQHSTVLQEQDHGAKRVDAAAHVECPAPERETELTRADCSQYGQQRGGTFVTWSPSGVLHGATPKGRCRVCDGLVALGGVAGALWEVYRVG